MHIAPHFKSFFLLLFLFVGQLLFAQLSKTHYIPPLTSSQFGNANPEDQYIYLSTPNNLNIKYTIKPVGQPATGYITGNVSRTAPQEIYLATGNGQLFIPSTASSTVANNRGYIIEADAPIYVSVRMNAGGGAQAGALVSKGLSALGTIFRVGCYTNENPQDNYLNFVSVMATEDNTQVTFSNLPAGLIIKNYSGATPVITLLNKGESYTIATNSLDSVINRDGLIGCLVTSTKPIVVNTGSANGSFSNGGGRDYGIDQIVGLDKVGTEYIFVKGDGSNAWENILIVAHSNNTTISINGSAPVATLNAGQYYLIEGNQYTTVGNMYVQTSQPVFAYQGVGATTSEANQGMFFVPPLSCETRGNLDNIAQIQKIGTTIYTGGISIVTKVGATVTVNNAPISSFSTIGPSTVTGNPNYVTYKVTGLTGNISVQSTDELYCAYFNYNGAATSGSFYSGFPSAPEINFDAEFVTLGNCIPNIKLSAANIQNFDSFKWLFDDGNGGGFIEINTTDSEITPTLPGKYKLIGVIACTGEQLESVEVPVSICPDDIDNDGIIDNLDIDNDNDGILNCTESKGDVTMDLSDTRDPILRFQDGTFNNALATDTVVLNGSSAGTIQLTSSGKITSTIAADSNGENSYSIDFTESVNVKFSEDSSSPHTIITDEYFIVSILPINKNITLVDPDNRLLIDSNFDGIFENGITMISGSEIHFKINPSPLGTTPYMFLANHVDSFTITHRLSNILNNSTYTGIISLTCFNKDTDSDGIEDSLDLDSDNDGIPDFVENQGTLVTLSGLDVDLNGLDDVYNINANPIDSDSDGVYDFYDLDSDNDGIYDVLESGSNLPDVDFDGIIDNVNATIGTNGWDDNAETTPDSNVIGYTPNDLDTDSIYSYIDLDSDGDGCSDVIEAGFSDGNSDGLLGDNAVTVNAFGVVNNAADGYTLPNTDYLTAAPIIISTQPINTEVCELSNAIISVTHTAVDTIQWELSLDGINWITIVDNSNYSGSQTSDLTIIAAPLSYNSYQYRAFLNVAGNSCGLYTDEIELTVIELPIANTAPNMLQCDDDNNGTMPFDLTLQNASINTTAGMTITYHTSQLDANTGNAPLTSPYESGNATIYARVVNDLNTNCYDTSSFNLEVYESPVPLSSASITPIQECDNTSVGTDTDGFIIFDLTQRETEILNGQSATDFSLTYFTDSGYANQIANPTTFSNTIATVQTIYVRMTNNFYNTCIADTSFEIEVYTLPLVNNPSKYSQCDDASNDGQAYFNLELTSIKEEINPNYVAVGLTFTFYEDQTAAETNGLAIVNPSNYQDALGFINETIWIRVENPNGCFRVVPLTLEVTPSSAALGSYNPNSIYQCDDGLDVRDGVSTFDLTPIKNHITNTIFSGLNVTVYFYESQLDAELETNVIADASQHQNTNYPNQQDIWVRIKSDFGNNCLGLERFPNLLIVEALPTANPVTLPRQCDYDTTDTVLSYPFDTSQLENNLLNGQNPANVTISYFDSSGAALLYADGTAVTSPIQPIFLSENQTITIRVTNNSTQDPDGACFDETTVDFIVDEQPIVAGTIPPQEFCDDGLDTTNENDGLHNFSLATFESIIRGSQTNMTIYFSYIDENGLPVTNATSLPASLISANQTIAVEVINPINTSCNATTSIDLIVNPVPEFSLEEDIIVCGSPFVPFDLIPVQANPSETFTYQWTFEDGTVLGNTLVLQNIQQPGKYTVTLTNPATGCLKSLSVDVLSADPPNITINDIEIKDLSENNSVTILNPPGLGNSTYIFSLVSDDGYIFFPYQSSPVFNNLRAGFYTLYVKDEGGLCDEVSLEIAVIGHRKFFTPNGDGTNDFWQIQGMNSSQANSIIQIFDRYGKLLKQLDPLSRGWDGTFNGAMLPTDDYWFKLLLQDGRSLMGHFTLKR